MDTFLDTGLSKTRTFILYGNLKDTVWCGDLIPRDMEQYLVKLLKSRGYRHVIFYGGAGTKGAYCLDRESACFFFAENHSLPLPKPLILKGSRLKEDSDDPDEDEAEDQESSQELKQKAGSAAKPSGGRVHSMMDRLRGGNRHVSGSLADDEDEDDEPLAEERELYSREPRGR